jgi:hypothetical protein
MAGKVILDTDILSEYLKGYDVNVVARGNRLNQNEEIIPLPDDYRRAATIKATAAKHYPLVTGNTGHFQAIQGTGVGLVIENWRKP